MKKLLLFASLLIMLSCQSDNELIFETEQLRKDLMSMPQKDMRIAFSALSFEEGRKLWYDRIMLESEYHEGDKKYILVSFARKQLKKGFDPESHRELIVELFGGVEAKRILTTLYLPNEAPVNLSSKVMVPDAGSECGCAIASDWCDFQYNQGNPTEVWSCKPCGGGANYRGCGTGFIYFCNGNCMRSFN
jgi:hypothetical protein